MGASNYVFVDVLEIKRETESAFLVVMKEGGEEVWLPKSQISDPGDYKKGDTDLTLAVTQWIARQKNLEVHG